MYDAPEIIIDELIRRVLTVRPAPEAIGGWDIMYEDGTHYDHFDLSEAPTEIAALNLAAVAAYEAVTDEVKHLCPAHLEEPR